MMNFLKKHYKKIITPIVVVVVLAGVFFPFRTNAAIALVQTAQGGYGYVNTYSQPLSTNVTAGNTIIVVMTAGDANTVSSVNDTLGNTYNLIASDLNSGQRQTWMYYAYNVAGGSDTVNVTWGGCPTSCQYADSAIIVREYSGLTTTDPLDKSAHANDGGSFLTTHNTGTTPTTTVAPELVVAASGVPDGNEPGWGYPSGYANGVHQKGSDLYTYEAMADMTLSSGVGTQTATFTTTDSVVGQSIIAVFKASGSAPPPAGAATSTLKVPVGILQVRAGILRIR